MKANITVNTSKTKNSVNTKKKAKLRVIGKDEFRERLLMDMGKEDLV